MIIAVDLTGSDKGPKEVFEGVRIALLNNRSLCVIPTGPKQLINLLRIGFGDRIVAGYDASEVSSRRNSATAKAIRLLDKHRADDHGGITANAGVFFGNTKDPVSWTLIGRDGGGLDLLPGVSYPPLALTMPTMCGKRGVYLDGGVTVDDITPEILWQFAWLGGSFAQVSLGITEPKVALHSNGEEAKKGDKLTQAAFNLLTEREFPGFAGNAQMTDLVANRIDVLVTDGFSGNKCFKTAEAYMSLMFSEVTRHSQQLNELEQQAVKKMMGLVYLGLGPSNFGSMPLLGIKDAIVMIGHGSSDRQAVAAGIERAMSFAELDLAVKIEQALPPEFRTAT